MADTPTPGQPLTPFQRQSLEQRQSALYAEWKTRNEKWQRLRAALAIETSAAVQFQLEQQIQTERTALDQLEAELEQIERSLLTASPSADNSSQPEVKREQAFSSAPIRSQPLNTSRLRQLEENIALLREQQGDLEQARILAADPLQSSQIKQRIRIQILPEIRKYEEEYWHILAEQNQSLTISEPEAEVVVGEIVQQVNHLETQQTIPTEALQLLRDIRDKLNQPGPTAAAKLKGVISSIPPFIGVSYETELDTENFFRTYFPTFRRWIMGEAKK